MPDFASARAAMRLMAAETRVTCGAVPASLGGIPVGPANSRLSKGEYLLHTDTGYRFHYRKGAGVTVDRPSDPDPAEEALWLNGSVYAAIASINGLMPIHASAVAFGGYVTAFTGPSGAGKSTLVAALGQAGLPLFCDDTLVLDLSDPGRIVCLPGHKRLKLTTEAIGLTGAAREEKVGAMIDKFFARPPAGDVREPLPLARLVFLEDGPEPAVKPVAGAQRLALLNDDHYTAELFALGQGLDLAGRFAALARLARQVAISRLVRPRGPARFAKSTTLAAAVARGA